MHYETLKNGGYWIAKSLVGQPSGGSNPLHSAIMTRFQGIGKTDALFCFAFWG